MVSTMTREASSKLSGPGETKFFAVTLAGWGGDEYPAAAGVYFTTIRATGWV
jgi:hypothetical protein